MTEVDYSGIAAIIAAITGLIAAIAAFRNGKKIDNNVMPAVNDTADRVSEIHDATVEGTTNDGTGGKHSG